MRKGCMVIIFGYKKKNNKCGIMFWSHINNERGPCGFAVRIKKKEKKRGFHGCGYVRTKKKGYICLNNKTRIKGVFGFETDKNMGSNGFGSSLFGHA